MATKQLLFWQPASYGRNEHGNLTISGWHGILHVGLGNLTCLKAGMHMDALIKRLHTHNHTTLLTTGFNDCIRRAAQTTLLIMVPREPKTATRYPLMLLAAMPPKACAMLKAACMS